MAQGDNEDSELLRLAEAVVRIRRGQGLTQEELAHRAGMSSRHLQELESSRLNPSYKVLVATARALGVPLSYLIVETERQAEPGST